MATNKENAAFLKELAGSMVSGQEGVAAAIIASRFSITFLSKNWKDESPTKEEFHASLVVVSAAAANMCDSLSRSMRQCQTKTGSSYTDAIDWLERAASIADGVSITIGVPSESTVCEYRERLRDTVRATLWTLNSREVEVVSTAVAIATLGTFLSRMDQE